MSARIGSPTTRLLISFLVALGVMTFGACGDDGDVDASDLGTTGAAAAGEEPDGDHDVGSADADSSGGSSGDESATTAPPTSLEGSAVTDVSVPAPAMDTAQLVAVRVGHHRGYDRVVFEFERGVPGHDIGYIDGAPIEDGSGVEVDVDGDVLSVRMTPASGVRIGPDGYESTYTGADRVAGGGDGPVTEVVQVGDFEAQATWAIGVEGVRPFAVSTLESPARLIVDIAA